MISASPITNNKSAANFTRPKLSIYDPEDKLSVKTENHTSHRVTQKEQTAKEEKNTLELIRNTAVNGTTMISLGTALLALVTRLFSKDPSKGLAAQMMSAAKASTKATFMTYGGFAAAKGYADNDAGVAASQALEVAIPALTTDPCNLTMNRGFSIGLGNFIVEAKKLFSKTHYGSFGESLDVLRQAIAKLGQDLRTNPLKALVNFRQGPGAMIMALITALAPILHKLTGLEGLTRALRHFPGMIQELGKANLGNLQRGASMYFTSGVLMIGSSLINLLGGLTGNKNLQTTIEVCTWLPNIMGRRLLVESMRQSELAQDHKSKPVTMMEAFKYSAKNLLGWRSVDDGADAVNPAKSVTVPTVEAGVGAVQTREIKSYTQPPAAYSYNSNTRFSGSDYEAKLKGRTGLAREIGISTAAKPVASKPTAAIQAENVKQEDKPAPPISGEAAKPMGRVDSPSARQQIERVSTVNNIGRVDLGSSQTPGRVNAANTGVTRPNNTGHSDSGRADVSNKQSGLLTVKLGDAA